MGIGDYNLDGHLDLFKTHFSEDMSGLYRNDGKGNFDNVTLQAKIGVETRYTSWGAGITDLDNDGYPDIFVVTGSVYPEVEHKLPQYPNKSPRILLRNLGNGTFEELSHQAGPAIQEAHCSRGCALGDFDNDGALDIHATTRAPIARYGGKVQAQAVVSHSALTSISRATASMAASSAPCWITALPPPSPHSPLSTTIGNAPCR